MIFNHGLVGIQQDITIVNLATEYDPMARLTIVMSRLEMGLSGKITQTLVAAAASSSGVLQLSL